MPPCRHCRHCRHPKLFHAPTPSLLPLPPSLWSLFLPLLAKRRRERGRRRSRGVRKFPVSTLSTVSTSSQHAPDKGLCFQNVDTLRCLHRVHTLSTPRFHRETGQPSRSPSLPAYAQKAPVAPCRPRTTGPSLTLANHPEALLPISMGFPGKGVSPPRQACPSAEGLRPLTDHHRCVVSK